MDEALRSGDLAPLLLELGLDPSVNSVESFINAMAEKEARDTMNE